MGFQDRAPGSVPVWLPRRAVMTAVAATALGPRAGRAQAGADWPRQPVHYISPFAPGGALDTLSRLYCAKMAELTGQTFLVENRVGSGGTVGTEALAKARPDGYTLGQAGSATLAMAPTLYSKLPYDPGRDFTFVCGHWRGSYVLVVAPDFPTKSLPELLALLRTHPGRYTYASPGPGTPQHIAAEMLKRQANVDMLHVPYRGGAPALLDLLAGRVDMLFDLINGPLQAAREGKVRVLAVLTQQRNPVLPEVPAAAEIVPGVAVSSWTLVCGPAGIPKAVVSRISDLTRQAMESPDIASRYRELGIEPWWAPGEPMAAFRAEEEARLAPVIRASGAHLD